MREGRHAPCASRDTRQDFGGVVRYVQSENVLFAAPGRVGRPSSGGGRRR